MNTIVERLKKILSYYHLTSAQFAKELGIQKSSVSHLLSGRNKPSFQFLSKLTQRYPEINLKWFIAGEGDIFDSEINNRKETILTSPSENENDRFEKGLSEKNKTNKKLAAEKSTTSEIENIILIYDNDSFKILKKSNS